MSVSAAQRPAPARAAPDAPDAVPAPRRRFRLARLMGAPGPRDWARGAARVAPTLLLAAAAWILWREFHTLTAGQVLSAAASWGAGRILAALGLTVLSFGLLALIEALGLRWAGVRAPLRTAALGALCANAFAHSLGFALVTGTAARTRIYARCGASLGDVTQITAFYGAAFSFGMAALGGLMLVLQPGLAAAAVAAQVSPDLARAVGAVLLLGPGLYVVACATLRREVSVLGHRLALPTAGMALAQISLGLVENAVTAAVAWVLIPHVALPYAGFVGPYVAGTVAGIASHAPGGVGVFEGVILTLLPAVPRATLAAAFLGYRLIYFLLPLSIAAALLLHSGTTGARLGRLRRAAPGLLGAGAFVLGSVLIMTAVGRIDPGRVAVLRATVPLALLETSHLLSLVAGLALMASAPGLLRRRVRAHTVAAVAAALGASTALLRGLDLGPALLATAFGIALLSARGSFRRRGSWGDRRAMLGWSLALLAVVVGVLALGLWVYADTHFEARLWDEFGYRADPARFVRSVAVLGAALLAAGAFVLTRAGTVRARIATADEADQVRPLVEASPDTTARLALTGDKALLRAADGSAFIMYGAEGRSLVAMGDPVGDRDAGRALLWRLKEMADAADARLVVYQGSPAWLVDYLDLGLSLLKLGEEARTALGDFSLQGGARRNLRQGHSRAVREGLTFELARPPHPEALIAALAEVSESWLRTHGRSEKGFSLGWFDPAALEQDPLGVVRQGGRAIAFANVWTGGGVEASVDLMRHIPDHPPGAMEFLLVELMLWAKAEGFQRFNLGMAPLAGFAAHPLAPLWHKLGAQVARRGRRFYHFQGLRAFKAKFAPEWRPRYLGAPPLAVAGALLDVSRLVDRSPPPLRDSLTEP